MKSNIDLTDNHIFIRRSVDLSNRLLMNVYEKIYPWKVYHGYFEDMGKQRNAIIATGNKVERAEVKLLRQMDSGNYCERCGKQLNLKPWNKRNGLCERCDEDLAQESQTFDKRKWRSILNITI